MLETKKSTLIFWFHTPPKVSKGAFNYITKHWGEKVIFVINVDLPDYRKATNWNDGDFGDAEVIMLDSVNDEQKKIAEIFEQYPNAIHVVSGFTNDMQNKIQKYILVNGVNLAFFSERPVTMGNSMEKLARKLFFNIKYRALYKKFNGNTKLLLPLGMKGVHTFSKYGWNREIMFPFMYNPVNHTSREATEAKSKNDKVKFLYVGRFYYKTKGINTLMKATERLRGNNWKLDLVGGYGKDAKKVIDWAQKQENVEFIGSWDSTSVADNMQNYDVVIVPSNYDGWNLLVNEAIYAGIGVIVTDEAVSDEVINSSKSGRVVPSKKPKEMSTAMQYVIDNPDKIVEWKKNAKEYKEKISPEIVGNYLIDVLEYVFIDKNKKRPRAPWL